MAWSRVNIRKLVSVKEGLANPSHIYFHPPIKIEPQTQEAAISQAIITPKVEKCEWGPNCLISKNMENEEENWNGDRVADGPMHSKHTANTTAKPSTPEFTHCVKSPTVTGTDTKCAMPTKQSKGI